MCWPTSARWAGIPAVTGGVESFAGRGSLRQIRHVVAGREDIEKAAGGSLTW